VTRLIADQLRHRVRSQGAGPLLTYYDLNSGERTELSATTCSNWVDKASNLLVEELDVGPGAPVDLELARSAPGHWVTFVVALAAWQVGAVVRVGTKTPDASSLLVLGPDWEQHDLSSADAVLACSLHPLGLGFAKALPAGVTDFSLEVRAQSDVYLGSSPADGAIAWVDDHRQLSQADLVLIGADRSALRRLVRPGDPWSTVRDGLLLPLRTGGSTVLVVGGDPNGLSRVAAAERAIE